MPTFTIYICQYIMFIANCISDRVDYVVSDTRYELRLTIIVNVFWAYPVHMQTYLVCIRHIPYVYNHIEKMGFAVLSAAKGGSSRINQVINRKRYVIEKSLNCCAWHPIL